MLSLFSQILRKSEKQMTVKCVEKTWLFSKLDNKNKRNIENAFWKCQKRQDFTISIVWFHWQSCEKRTKNLSSPKIPEKATKKMKKFERKIQNTSSKWFELCNFVRPKLIYFEKELGRTNLELHVHYFCKFEATIIVNSAYK